MLPRLTPEAFVDGEVAGFVSGFGWMLWRARRNLGGLVMWGHQGQAQAASIVRAANDGLRVRVAPKAPFTAILDLRRATAFDLPAFAAFDRWLVEVNASHPELRVALLGNRSPACAALFGLVQLAAPRIVYAHPSDLTTLLAEAKAPPGLLEHVDDLVSALQTSSPLEPLRAMLAERHGNLSLAGAARMLGRSARSLQRELAREGTSYERERWEVRKRAFEALVGEQSLKLDSVAALLGFASVRAFSTAFRRAVGVSPRAYRSQSASAAG